MTPHELIRTAFAETPAVARGRITTRTVELPGYRLVEAIFGPGARWSIDAAPFAGTEVCPYPHDTVVLSGMIGVKLSDHPPATIMAGDVLHLPRP